MRNTFRVVLLVAAALAAGSVPLAAAGHVYFVLDPCDPEQSTINLGFSVDQGCPGGERPCAGDGQEDWIYRGTPCADDDRDATCLAVALWSSTAYGTGQFEVARSEAGSSGDTVGGARSSAENVSLPGWVEEAAAPTSCLAEARACHTEATAAATDVNLFAGGLLIEAFESHVALDGCDLPQQTQWTRFSRITVMGVEIDQMVHPGTRVLVPGVGSITFGEQLPGVTVGSQGVRLEATALRIDVYDLSGTPVGVVLIGHTSVSMLR